MAWLKDKLLRYVICYHDGCHLEEDYRLCDIERVKKIHANVFHGCMQDYGGNPPPQQLLELISKWKKDIEQLRSADMKLIFLLDSQSFRRKLFREAGLDPEKYLGVGLDGKPMVGCPGFNGDYVVSCYANPHWLEFMKKETEIYAKAGFDGVFYDVVGFGVNPVCYCTYCQESFREYTKKVFGKEYSLPEKVDYTDKVYRACARWRWETYKNFFTEVHKHVKKINPEFAHTHNLHSGSPGHVYLYPHEFLDYLHLEEGKGPPHTMIYGYKFGLAGGKGKPVVLLSQIGAAFIPIPDQMKIAIAEGYVYGGIYNPSLHLAHHCEDIMKAIEDSFKFFEEYEEYYFQADQVCNVAIVYSWNSRLAYELPNNWRDPSRWFAQVLIDSHIPFDIIIAETDLKDEVIEKYDALILADLACMDDSQLETLEAYVKEGGGLLATGNTAKYNVDMEPRELHGLVRIIGEEPLWEMRRTVGKGRVAYFPDCPEEKNWKVNNRGIVGGLSSPEMRRRLLEPLPQNLLDALRWVSGGKYPIEAEACPFTAVNLTSKPDMLIAHLLNYNIGIRSGILLSDYNIRLRVNLPPDREIGESKRISLDFEGEKPVEYTVKEGVANIEVDKNRIYSAMILKLT